MKNLLREKKKLLMGIAWGVFVLYLLILLRLTVFRGSVYPERQWNLRLFAGLVWMYRNTSFWEFLRQFFGNIGWFFPLGFFLPFLLKRLRFFPVAAIGFALSLAIELIQYFTRLGVCELDDVILNTLGTVLGYWVYRLLLYYSQLKRGTRFPRIFVLSKR